jgi:hypothetical protein
MFLCCSYTDVIAAFETRIDPIAFAGLGSAPTSAERRQLPELNRTSGGLRSGEGLTSPLGFIASGAPAIVPATRAASPPSQRHASAPPSRRISAYRAPSAEHERAPQDCPGPRITGRSIRPA